MDYSINTKCVQAGYTPGNGEPRQIPIYQSTTYKYDTSEDMGKLFDLEAEGYFYSRLRNPTNDYVAAKIAALEGGTAGMLTSSGQAANFFAIFNICEAGSHVVSSSSIYGGTYNLLAVTMKKMGVDVTFVDPDCTKEELNAAFKENTKAVFGESIANPALTVLDIEKFAKAAHAHGVPLIVDNTFPTPVNLFCGTGIWHPFKPDGLRDRYRNSDTCFRRYRRCTECRSCNPDHGIQLCWTSGRGNRSDHGYRPYPRYDKNSSQHHR